ncbi:MAG: ABC transporter ATP-binding protein [Eubacteriaceae bacterium]|nr:ABC transporter ATP-binding protein [Eubacteriaceae bacterium]
MDEPVISVDNVSVVYKNTTSFSYRKLAQQLIGNRSQSQRASPSFTALSGITFDVAYGETVGVVGENGSGKSTLLRAIAGIYTPDEGTIVLRCPTVSLLALGIGFQSRLTGMENILLSGLAMGFSKKEIAEKTSEIIEFSELEDFIDKPVKAYSSGMYSKLSFAINAILTTDVLLIDEVLSVGDMRFQVKSRDKLMELVADKKRSVVIVSHSQDVLKQMCNRVLWISKGRQVDFGLSGEVISAYESFMMQD